MCFSLTNCSETTNHLENGVFDKKRWLSDSGYRFMAIKDDLLPDLSEMTEEEVIHVLGEPDGISKRVLIYCFNVGSPKKYDPELGREVVNCNGSYISIDFTLPKKWRVTIAWVEMGI